MCSVQTRDFPCLEAQLDWSQIETHCWRSLSHGGEGIGFLSTSGPTLWEILQHGLPWEALTQAWLGACC